MIDHLRLVDAFHRAPLDAGGRDNGALGRPPHHQPRYCGGNVLDADDDNVEAACHAAGAAA